MSLHEYQQSVGLERADFYALIMAAMRRADSINAAKLRRAFPDTWHELQARYNAPGGLLPGEAGYEETRDKVREVFPEIMDAAERQQARVMEQWRKLDQEERS